MLLQIGDGPGPTALLGPSGPDPPDPRLIEKNGGRSGLEHLVLRVTGIGKAFDYVKQHGFRIIDPAPRKGHRGPTVFYVHPRTQEMAAFGPIIEVVQEGNHA